MSPQLQEAFPCSLPLGQVRNSRVCDPQGRETLFLEMMFRLMSLGFVPHKSVQEVMRWAQLYRALGLGMEGLDSAPCRSPQMSRPLRREP